jgi:hypothetical protein
MKDDELDYTDEELLDIIAPLDYEYDETGFPLGDIQGCERCGWNPDLCDCGLYPQEEEDE